MANFQKTIQFVKDVYKEVFDESYSNRNFSIDDLSAKELDSKISKALSKQDLNKVIKDIVELNTSLKAPDLDNSAISNIIKLCFEGFMDIGFEVMKYVLHQKYDYILNKLDDNQLMFLQNECFDLRLEQHSKHYKKLQTLVGKKKNVIEPVWNQFCSDSKLFEESITRNRLDTDSSYFWNNVLFSKEASKAFNTDELFWNVAVYFDNGCVYSPELFIELMKKYKKKFDFNGVLETVFQTNVYTYLPNFPKNNINTLKLNWFDIMFCWAICKANKKSKLFGIF